MLRARYRHILRFREIGKVFTKHGLGHFVGLLSRREARAFRKQRPEVPSAPSVSARVRMALEELGPAFVKLGQLLSTRPDLFPPDLITELERLQDRVQPVAFDEIRGVLDPELGGDYREVFAFLDETPLASASIGQVHRGVLLTGEEVVVKVQRPGVRKIVETDLEILQDSARLLQKNTKLGAFYRVEDMTHEFVNSIREELDYTVEGRNADRLAGFFTGEPTVRFPKIFWEFSSPRVLILEYVPGIKINNVSALREQGHDLSQVARNLANAVFKQIYIHGFFHADPHPGNLAVLEQETILFMDFGQVGRIAENLRGQLVSLVLAVVGQDSKAIVDLLIEIGRAQDKLDAAKLQRDIDRLIGKYYHLPMHLLKLGDVLQEMLQMAYEYQIRVPVEIVLLGKTLVTLEGVVQQLDPKLSIVDLAEPFGRVLLREKFSPRNLKKLVLQNGYEQLSMLLRFPRRLDNLAGMAENGQIKIKLDHLRMNYYVNKLTRASNRLAISITVAAIILGTSILSLRSQQSFLWRFPVAEIGFIFSLVTGLWLLISILRSSRL